jgi:hypothetical protein
MRSSLTTAEDFYGALHWEQVRAAWFERIGNHRMASYCMDLARDYGQRIERLGGQING